MRSLIHCKREQCVKGSIFNLPNLISLLRALTAFPIVYGIKHNQPIVFLWVGIAVITDWLDGFLARRLHMESTVGAIIDPIADFVVIASVMTFFTLHGYISQSLWWLMFFRYLTIFIAATILINYTEQKPKSNLLGKCSVCVFCFYALSVWLSFNQPLMTITLYIFVTLLLLSWGQYLKTYATPILKKISS
ncbi:MAG: CDP-alcohol phosphatidyltransferase family protein [Gammaproteobacteria bacterium]|nr:CDP-alcohol phosphatidyltransferase family protein [Gammaproteobacteria bacterium]